MFLYLGKKYYICIIQKTIKWKNYQLLQQYSLYRQLLLC